MRVNSWMQLLDDTSSCAAAFVHPRALIEEVRNGRMVVMVEDEAVRRGANLVMAAEVATPEAINFMARFGRGLIRLALPEQRMAQLGIPMMSGAVSVTGEEFGVSIEAAEGVTTGISVHDRAATIAAAMNPRAVAADIVTPGHMFPVLAKDGGLLARAGHAEAAVDLARIAGAAAGAVMCHVLGSDGSVARGDELVRFCLEHDLRIGSVQDLLAFCRQGTERAADRLVA